MIALSEVERRQEYLDEMTGEAEVLRSLVEECLDYDPIVRPSIATVCKRIQSNKDACMKDFPQNFMVLYQLAERLKIENEQSANKIQLLNNENELQKSTAEYQRTEMKKQQIVSS